MKKRGSLSFLLPICLAIAVALLSGCAHQSAEAKSSFKNEAKTEAFVRASNLHDINFQRGTDRTKSSNGIRIPLAEKAVGCGVFTAGGDYLGEVIMVLRDDYEEDFIIKSDEHSPVYRVLAKEDSFKEIDVDAKMMVVVRWRSGEN